MKIRYICPAWGQEHLNPCDLLERVVAGGYDGIEINLPPDQGFIDLFRFKLNLIRSEVNKDFVFIAQQVLPPAVEDPDEYIQRMVRRLRHLASLEPDFINSHTGKDYYDFDANCRIIDAAMHVAEKTGVRVLHETHRGRFTFHAAGLPPYLEKFPQMQLVGDFSHWCTVSESMLEDQADLLKRIIPHVVHIHARVGYEHGPQVNNPFAPEWQGHVDAFIGWWRMIIEERNRNNSRLATITPEFGPAPYMPQHPFTQEPVADQWKINAGIKELLKTRLAHQPQTIL